MDTPEPSLRELAEKIDAMSQSIDKLRKYFQITMWVTIVVLVVPLFGAMFIMPMFMNSYLGAINSAQLETLSELQGL